MESHPIPPRDRQGDQTLYTLGNLTVDDIVLYDQRQMHLASSGGDALFSAIGAWIWHRPAGLIARAGQAYPQANIDLIQNAGIACRLQRVPYPDIRNWALYEPDGSRQFRNHCVSGTYKQMSIRGEEIPPDCLDAAAFHIAPMPVEIQQSVLQRLRSRSCLITLDTFPQHLTAPHHTRILLDLLPDLDAFLPSREEAAILYGSRDEQAAARAFAGAGAKLVCIKLGAEGSLLYLPQTDQFRHVPACRVDALDPTGAGDSFCGGFLAGLLHSGDALTATCYGTVSASYVVETVGALSVLEMDLSARRGLSARFERLEQVREGITTA